MLIFFILCIICNVVIEIVNQKASLYLSKADQNQITRIIARIPCVLIRLIQQVKRFHDLWKSWWNCLWLLLAGIAWLIVIPCLLFVPWEEKTNQYGPQVVFRNQKKRKKSDYDREDEQMKRCPFCGEKILQRAIKCKHCWEMLSIGGIVNDEEENGFVSHKLGD